MFPDDEQSIEIIAELIVEAFLNKSLRKKILNPENDQKVA